MNNENTQEEIKSSGINNVAKLIDNTLKKYLHEHDASVCYTPLRIVSYFIIYSFIGYVIEVLYGIVTDGVIGSRQGFIYGPFCEIYGVGAVTMILTLQFFKKNTCVLFLGRSDGWFLY